MAIDLIGAWQSITWEEAEGLRPGCSASWDCHPALDISMLVVWAGILMCWAGQGANDGRRDMRWYVYYDNCGSPCWRTWKGTFNEDRNDYR